MVSLSLQFPIAINGFGMVLAVLFPVALVRLPPFLLARTHVFGIDGIVSDSFAVIIAAPTPLTIRLTADALFWSIRGGLEDLLAVPATATQSHSRPCSPRRSLIEPPSKTEPARQNIETFIEFLPRPCRWAFQSSFTWLRQTGGFGAVSHRH
jgi:hypothetical protein